MGHIGSASIGAEGSLYIITASGRALRIGRSPACPSGKAIPLNFSSTSDSYTCESCPSGFAPNGGTCIFCAGISCPIAPINIPQTLSLASLGPTNVTGISLTLQTNSSVILASDLVLSGFDLLLKDNSRLQFESSIEVNQNSTLTVAKSSELKSRSVVSSSTAVFDQEPTITCTSLTLTNASILKLKGVEQDSVFGIHVLGMLSIDVHSKIDGRNESECVDAMNRGAGTVEEFRALKFLQVNNFHQCKIINFDHF